MRVHRGSNILELILKMLRFRNVPNAHKASPNLRDGAPKEIIINLVKPERILGGYGPGIEAKLDATSYSHAYDMCSKPTSASGSVSLFGFCIGGAGASKCAQN